METKNLKKALEDLVIEYKRRLKVQAKIDKTYATGEFAKSFKSDVTEKGFQVYSTAKHVTDVDSGAKKNQTNDIPNLGNILKWARLKKLRPYKKLPSGMTSFVRISDKSMLSMAIAISKGIKKKGTIKRYKYKGSEVFDRVYDAMERKIGIDVGSAYGEDLKEELLTVVKKYSK